MPDWFQVARNAFAPIGAVFTVWKAGRWLLRKTLAERFVIVHDFRAGVLTGVSPLRLRVDFQLTNKSLLAIRPTHLKLLLLHEGQRIADVEQVVKSELAQYSATGSQTKRGHSSSVMTTHLVPSREFWGTIGNLQSFLLAEGSSLRLHTFFGDFDIPLGTKPVLYVGRDTDRRWIDSYLKESV